MPFLPDPATVESRRIAALHRHWSDLKRDRPVPLRDDLDPADIKELLPNVMLVDIEPEPFRVRYRLVGTEIVTWAKFDFTGFYLDMLTFSDLDDSDVFVDGYRAVHRTGQPHFARIRTFEFRDRELFYECGLLPLSSDGTAIDKALAIEDYAHLSPDLLREMPASGPRG
ncbi:PAS domain-containing protein [Tistlia consotensis]|uniref:PAS domain-containing protein n=1 Tax=Tistlia consotensis USBA 355 TaxID=560819 RepID=A0A1Y6B3H1_9PROT|nr:PAS domain-containing protein [Tistlia consotensis]SME88145.1 PAS domain-containing protein [Tistlia consotensis USBA 355]SNR24516.1 PAS domain-containing protein [Tistlia consotensis]